MVADEQSAGAPPLVSAVRCIGFLRRQISKEGQFNRSMIG
jgi:hypothetical protein